MKISVMVKRQLRLLACHECIETILKGLNLFVHAHGEQFADELIHHGQEQHPSNISFA